MTRYFNGVGSGKREQKTKPEPAEKKKRRGPFVHTRFKPYITYGMTKTAAERCGAFRDKEGATHVTSEAQLNRYLANEKAAGREVHWKQH